LPLGQCGKRLVVPDHECSVEPARLDQQLDESCIRFCCGKRVGPRDQHRDLPPGAPQPYRHGDNLGFVVRRARQGCRCCIEECTEPGRAQMNIDLIGPDIDAVDEGGQKGTLSCSGQLGPALADFPGARDEPALS